MFLIISLIAWLGLVLFRKWKILDKPGNDLKDTRRPVPTLQGIFVYLVTFVVLAIFHWEFFLSPLVQGFLVGGTLIVIIELLAELEYLGKIKRKIPPWFRFLVHLIAACLALWISGIADYEFILFDYVFVIPNWLLYLAFAFWSVFVINAVNWIDGINAQGNGILSI